MIPQMRPATLGEILDRTVNIYRSRFLVFFGIASAPSAVMLACIGGGVLLVAWAARTSGREAAGLAGLAMMGMFMLAFPVYVAASALSNGAMCLASSAHVLGGRAGIAATYREAWKRGWSFIGLYLLQGLIVWGVPMMAWAMLVGFAAGMAAVAGSTEPPVAFLMLVFLGLAVVALWMLLRVCLAFPVAVLERTTVGAAMKRAGSLSLGTRWRMLLLFVMVMILGWMVSGLLTAPIAIGVAMIPGMTTPQRSETLGTIALIVWYASCFLVQALTRPVYGIALVLFYYDQRIRQEALDIEVMMGQAGMTAEVVQLAPVAAQAPEKQSWQPPIASIPLAPENHQEPPATDGPTEASGGNL